ncbi:MAG: hypothetical protein WCL60_01355 [Methylococcales bacterium]
MPEIKFTFTGEERGLYAEALRSAGAIDAAGRAASAATMQLTRQESAVAKLQIGLSRYEKTLGELSKRKSLAIDTGASETSINKITSSMGKLEAQVQKTKDALLLAKLSAGVAQQSQSVAAKKITYMDASKLGGKPVSDFVKQMQGQTQPQPLKNPFEVRQNKATSDFINRMQKNPVDSDTALSQLFPRQSSPNRDLGRMGGKPVSDFVKQMQGQPLKNTGTAPKPTAELSDFAKKMQTGSAVAEQTALNAKLKEAKELTGASWKVFIDAKQAKEQLGSLQEKYKLLRAERDRLGQKVIKAEGAGETAEKIDKLKAAFAGVNQKANDAKAAMDTAKITAMSEAMGQLEGKTTTTGGSFSKLAVFAGGAGTAVATALKAAAAGGEGLKEALAAASEQNKAQSTISKAAIGGDKNAKVFIDTIRGDTGVSAEVAASYYNSLHQSGEDNQQGRALVQQMTGTVETPELLLENAAKLKTANIGFNSNRQVVDTSLAASTIPGVMAKPTELSGTLLSIASTVKGVGGDAPEAASIMAMALHMTKDTEKAAAAAKNIGNAITARNLGGQGMIVGINKLAAQMPKGFFSEDKQESANAMRSQVGGSGLFSSVEEAENFKRMRNMLIERPEVQKNILNAFNNTGPGDALDLAFKARTPEMIEEQNANRVKAKEEISKSSTYGAQSFRKEKMLSAIGDASAKEGELEGSASIRKFIASSAYDINRLFGSTEKDSINGAFHTSSLLGDITSPNNKVQAEARSSFESSNGDLPITKELNDTNKNLTEAVKGLTTAIEKQHTDTRMPLPAPSPNYQHNQPQWQNRGQ